jgi:transcriptional regulator with XRE-family HTH domain
MGKRGRPRKQQKQQQPAGKATKAAPPANASPSRKTDTIEWLAAQMRDGDVERVRSLFENMTPLAKPEVYQVGKPRTILRTVVQQGVEYERFGPDGWQAPYVVIRATVDPEEKAESDFHYHLGEELLTPIDGTVTYQYYWTHGMQELIVEPGNLVRMNCQLPHRNWATPEHTQAWMAIRPETGSTASVGLDTKGHNVIEKLSQSISKADASNPGKFALVALGLQSLLKIARLRVGLSIEKLALLCEISQSSASRIEDLKTANVSVHTLAKIADKLDLDLSRVFPSFNWNYRRAELSGAHRAAAPLKSTVPPVRHYLHPIYWHLQSGQRIEHLINGEWPDLGADNIHSFVVLAGRVLFDIGDRDNPQSIALNTQGVLHIRDNPDFSMQALTTCSVLHIVYSSVCVCGLQLKGMAE